VTRLLVGKRKRTRDGRGRPKKNGKKETLKQKKREGGERGLRLRKRPFRKRGPGKGATEEKRRLRPPQKQRRGLFTLKTKGGRSTRRKEELAMVPRGRSSVTPKKKKRKGSPANQRKGNKPPKPCNFDRHLRAMKNQAKNQTQWGPLRNRAGQEKKKTTGGE